MFYIYFLNLNVIIKIKLGFFFKKHLSLENLDTCIPGLVIGTIPGQAGDVFTPWFDYIQEQFLLDGNELKLGPQFIFDFESKKSFNPSFVTIDGNDKVAGYTSALSI